jgi:hypothetical protein
MTCEEYRVSALEGRDTAAMHEHAAACADCARITPDLRATATVLADRTLWEEPSPELDARVMALIDGSAPHTGDPATPPRRRRAPIAAAVAVAAAVVVAVIAWSGLAGPAPDWEVAIVGTDLAPDASGSVRGWNVDAGTRVEFDVDGLDPAPPGHFYEIWFSRDRVHLSAGTFLTVDDVTATVGAARRDFPRIWVTLEPADEDESPSRHTVLDTG